MQGKDAWKEWTDETVKKIERKILAVRERSRLKIPSGAIGGAHDNMMERPEMGGISYWTNGFWAGIMWLMYSHTRDEGYADAARFTETVLDKAMDEFEGINHDAGFMWLPSAVADYALTGEKRSRQRALHAATVLTGRFNAAGNYIKAWDSAWFDKGANAAGVSIIDTMMNLSLLYWASRETGDPRFCGIATRHAETAMNSFVREDGSVRHIVEFNPETGAFVRDYGGQGLGQGSAWTRGQAWGLYGFALSYIHTQKKEFFDTAAKIAEYFISHIPESGLIPCDFMQDASCGYEDDIAAAAASCGLIELSRRAESRQAEKYLAAARKMLFALCEKSCDWDEATDGILQKCTVAYSPSSLHNVNIVYGDYFFIEALLKLHGSRQFMWGL